LSLHGLSHSVPSELSQQVQGRLYALYGDRFQFDFPASTINQLRITLQSAQTIPGEASHA